MYFLIKTLKLMKFTIDINQCAAYMTVVNFEILTQFLPIKENVKKIGHFSLYLLGFWLNLFGKPGLTSQSH